MAKSRLSRTQKIEPVIDTFEREEKLEKLFEGKEIVKLQEKELEKFLNGVKIDIDKKDGIYKIYDDKEKFIGIGVEKNKKMKRDVIL